MQAGYFQTAWSDIKHSDGWLKKFALLALLQLIPIFGQIVLLGYVYGWARDIAWNIHAPLPERIFGNEDGKLYSRGFFVLVIVIVFSLVASFASAIATALGEGGNSFLELLSSVLSIASLLFSLLCTALAWVGSMRSAIYGRIGPGFQIKQIWKMARYDSNGLMRILGMSLIFGIIFGVILGLVITTIALIVGMGAVFVLDAGVVDEYEVFMRILPHLGIGSVFLLLFGYVFTVACVWLEALVARAMGYWTRQFNVPAWGGQDDPLPFEVGNTAAQAQQAQYAAQVEYAQAQADYAQMQGQRINQQDAQAQQQYAQAAQAAQAQAAQVQPGQQVQQAQPAQSAQQAQSGQPDWIAQASAMAPVEQRDPYTFARTGAADAATPNQAPSASVAPAGVAPAAAAPAVAVDAAAAAVEAQPAVSPFDPPVPAPAATPFDPIAPAPATTPFESATAATAAVPVAAATASAAPITLATPAAPAAAVHVAASAATAAAAPAAMEAASVAGSQDSHHRIEAKPAPSWKKVDADAFEQKSDQDEVRQ